MSINCQAKIADPAPLIKKGIRYSSHMNTVTATQIEDEHVLWTLKLPINSLDTIDNDELEADVQMNIITSLSFADSETITATFRTGQRFLIELATGKWTAAPIEGSE